jgi:hypothetical protein
MRVQTFKPPPSSSPAVRGGGKRWGWDDLNDLNDLNYLLNEPLSLLAELAADRMITLNCVNPIYEMIELGNS